MAFNTFCNNTQMVSCTAAPTFADPNTGEPVAASVEGALRVTVISGDGSFSQDPASPLSVNLISGDATGTPEAPANTIYEVRADADLAPDVESLIVETLVLSVIPAPPPPIPQASAFGFSAAAPVPKVVVAARR